MAVDQSPLQLPPGTQLTFNLNPQIVTAVSSVVAQEIRGNVNLAHEDQQLLALIRDHAGDAAAQLASAVHELGDPDVPKPGRLVAKQRLKKFVSSLGSRLGDVGIGLLQTYLERKFGL